MSGTHFCDDIAALHSVADHLGDGEQDEGDAESEHVDPDKQERAHSAPTATNSYTGVTNLTVSSLVLQ